MYNDRLKSGYGLIIKWEYGGYESFDYCEGIENFVDDNLNLLDSEMDFEYVEDIHNYLHEEDLQEIIEEYKLIRLL